MRRLTVLALALLVVVAMNPGVALAQESKGGKPDMTPEQKAMMEAWMKVATPGENHKFLEPLVGSWAVKSTSWEKPDSPPEVSSGSAETTWILGGRFVQERFKGEYGGMPFDGLGFTGYDNYKKKYTAIWMDSMGTMTMFLTGTADAARRTLSMSGTVDDFMAGKPTAIRSVTRIVDARQHVYEMYGLDPTGKEFKMMELVYTRK